MVKTRELQIDREEAGRSDAADLRALVNAHDWAATPLGPREHWTASLKAAVELILPNSFPMIVLWGRELIQIYNDAYREIMADKHPAGLGQPTRECWPEVWHINAPIYERVWRGETLTFQDSLYPLARRHGQVEDVWLDLCYSPLRDDTGEVGGILVTLVEVTARHLLERERKQGERVSRRLAAIVEFSDDAIISKDLDGIIQTWNPGAERMFGYTAEEAIGKPLTILMPPNRVDEEPGILARVRRGERIEHYETVRRHKDGSLLDVSLSVSPIIDRDGKVVAASKVARDITLRRRAETALAEAGERQRFLLKLSDAIRKQPDEHAIGKLAVRMLAQHLFADRCFIAHLSRDEDRARVGPEYRRNGLPSMFGEAREVRLSRFPACLRQLETQSLVLKDIAAEPGFSEDERSTIIALQGMTAMVSAPLRSGTNDFLWVLVVGSATPRDWSTEQVRLIEEAAERVWAAVERARVEEALQENHARLLQANRAKDEFIAMLSHELRNPLAPIATTLELMKLRAPDVFVRERDIIEAQVHYLTGLVDDLLDVARIARGKIELKTEPLEVADIVAAAVETTQPMMEEHRQSLHTHVEDGLMVSGDRRRLVQVLVNLLGNAAKYSQPDRSIRLEAVAENGEVVLRVRDKGRGIAPELLPYVFDLFTQDPQSIERSSGGLGLGLAIVRNLVEMHGGSVKAASAGAGEGSVFTVRLPLLERRGTRGAPSRATEATAQPLETADLPVRTKVLIVDDYVLAAESLALLLQEMGYRTHVANDGAAALKAIDEFEPDVALVDIGLPVIDGYEVARTVRNRPERRALPLVAITGYGQASDHARVMDAGFDEHLVKPLNAGKIGELIEKLVAA